MATELIGYRSRVWLTCRHALTALDGAGCHAVLLGPLPSGEAALYLREHAGLSRMFFSPDASERALAMRLLNASRFHPLLMDRLAKLAVGGDALRPQLLQALDTLEQRKDFAQLPALFATTSGDQQELAYLHDALVTSLDQLIQDASPDARRLLWMIAVANEPVELRLLSAVWNGEDTSQMMLRRMMEVIGALPPSERQEQLNALSPELLAEIDALPPAPSRRPDYVPPLRTLVAIGLVSEERDALEELKISFSCHELVRERSRARMHDHPQERDGLTENAIRLAYADRLAAAFEALENQNMTAALSAGSRALVYCVQAEAYDRLAALIYRRVAELGQDMQSSLSNYAICFRRAHAAGTTLAVPRVADLLADPAFDPLARWLRGRQVDVDELQAAVDQLLEQVRQNAIG